MTGRTPSGPRRLEAPFVADGPTGVGVKTRLHVTDVEAAVRREAGRFLGHLAAKDLTRGCRAAHRTDLDAGVVPLALGGRRPANTRPYRTTPDHPSPGREPRDRTARSRPPGPASDTTAPTPPHQSDGAGHRRAQAQRGGREREGTRPPGTGPPTGGASPPGQRTREPSPPDAVRGRRTEHGLTHAQRSGTVFDVLPAVNDRDSNRLPKETS